MAYRYYIISVTARKRMKPLYQIIYDDLHMKIQSGEYKAGDVLPTENQLCAIYNVSRITATRALNELKQHGFIERKKKKGSVVLPVSYMYKPMAQNIAVVFSYFDNYETKIANALTPFAQKKNCSIMLFDTQHSKEKEREVLKYLLSQKIIGLIVWPITRSSNLDIFCQFALNNVPMCFMDYSSYGIKAPCICSDNYDGMYNITKHLISLGHRYIAYYPYKDNFLPTEEERFSAYCRAIIKNGAVLDPDYFIPMPDNIKNSTTENIPYFSYCAETAIRHILSLNLRPTAVVCVNDATAVHMIEQAKRHGLRVPEDLSVTGFDNVALAIQKEITTVSQDFGEMAKLALNMIFYQLANPTLINNYSGVNHIRSIIWERKSTARLEGGEIPERILPRP